MDIETLETLIGWPGGENTFLLFAPDGVYVMAVPDTTEELGQMAATDYAYAKYGPAFGGGSDPVWRLRRWHGCRTTGLADWLADARRFHHVRSILLLDGRGREVDEVEVAAMLRDA